MRKLAKYGAGLLALVCAFGLGRGGTAYTETDLALAREEAYNSGYHTGYEEGLTARQQSLYEEAFAAGQAEGYDNGYDTGFSEGSAQGAAQEEQAVLSAVGDTFTQGYDAGYSEGYAQKQKDDQAAREQYLASITPQLPVVASVEPIISETPAEGEQSEQITVYITNSGTKYHLDGCRHLKSKIEKTLEEAKALKLEPCKVCNPPK